MIYYCKHVNGSQVFENLKSQKVSLNFEYIYSQILLFFTTGAEALLQYFDNTYVRGPMRAVAAGALRLRLQRQRPTFPPETWNVHDLTLRQEPRTNNLTESWNNR